MNGTRALLGIAALLLALTGPVTASESMKCPERAAFPGVEITEPVVVADGVILEDGRFGLADLNIEWIEITCWDPETGKWLGSDRGINVIVVLTTESAADRGYERDGSEPAWRNIEQPRDPALEEIIDRNREQARTSLVDAYARGVGG